MNSRRTRSSNESPKWKTWWDKDYSGDPVAYREYEKRSAHEQTLKRGRFQGVFVGALIIVFLALGKTLLPQLQKVLLLVSFILLFILVVLVAMNPAQECLASLHETISEAWERRELRRQNQRKRKERAELDGLKLKTKIANLIFDAQQGISDDETRKDIEKLASEIEIKIFKARLETVSRKAKAIEDLIESIAQSKTLSAETKRKLYQKIADTME